ncbi:MAG: DUF389 domain-containing protein, partial [Erythrobacter sp.]
LHLIPVASVFRDEVALHRAEELAASLALVAGVSENDVTVDRERRRAVVRAKPLPGASLATFYELEQRLAARRPEWRIELTPPRGDLPQVSFTNGAPDAAGQSALDLIAWAAKRLDSPVMVVGPAAQTDSVVQWLKGEGVAARAVTGRSANQVLAEWDRATQ